jgi:hypothetical protein
MPDIWNYIKELFSSAEKSSPANPLVHEVIKRSEDEKAAYESWKSSIMKKRLVNWLHEQYAVFLTQPDNLDEAIDFLDTSSSKGFVVHFYQTNYNTTEITHLFDYLKERSLTHNYKTYLSDKRTYNREKWVESVHRHYLKPRPDFSATQLDQGFGNITIELIFRNDKPTRLKYSATHYSDAKYKEPERFEKLITTLLRA